MNKEYLKIINIEHDRLRRKEDIISKKDLIGEIYFHGAKVMVSDPTLIRKILTLIEDDLFYSKIDFEKM